MEISNLGNKVFKVMVKKMLSEFSWRMDEYSEILSKDRKYESTK